MSPAAWRGDDLRRSERWIDRLDGSDVAEIEAALTHARRTGKPLGELAADDFPLPSLRARLVRWRAAVAEGLGVQVVKGVPVERWSIADCERFFWCFGQHLGTVGAQNRDGELLGHVRDQGLSYDDPSVRGYKTAARLDHHCDAADAVGLLCLRTAKQGGTSRFVSSVTVWNELHARRPDLAARLFKPIAFDTRGDGGLDFFTVPPCRFSDGVLALKPPRPRGRSGPGKGVLPPEGTVCVQQGEPFPPAGARTAQRHRWQWRGHRGW